MQIAVGTVRAAQIACVHEGGVSPPCPLCPALCVTWSVACVKRACCVKRVCGVKRARSVRAERAVVR